MGKKKYGVILADPPWHYKVYSKKGAGRSAESHYPTMNTEDIKALPVSDIADKDCALFLWVTFPCLLEGLEVIKAWGFAYKTVAFAVFFTHLPGHGTVLELGFRPFLGYKILV